MNRMIMWLLVAVAACGLAAAVKVSELPSASSVSLTDVVPMVVSNQTVKATVGQLGDAITARSNAYTGTFNGSGGGLTNLNLAAATNFTLLMGENGTNHANALAAANTNHANSIAGALTNHVTLATNRYDPIAAELARRSVNVTNDGVNVYCFLANQSGRWPFVMGTSNAEATYLFAEGLPVFHANGDEDQTTIWAADGSNDLHLKMQAGGAAIEHGSNGFHFVGGPVRADANGLILGDFTGSSGSSATNWNGVGGGNFLDASDCVALTRESVALGEFTEAANCRVEAVNGSFAGASVYQGDTVTARAGEGSFVGLHGCGGSNINVQAEDGSLVSLSFPAGTADVTLNAGQSVLVGEVGTGVFEYKNVIGVLKNGELEAGIEGNNLVAEGSCITEDGLEVVGAEGKICFNGVTASNAPEASVERAYIFAATNAGVAKLFTLNGAGTVTAISSHGDVAEVPEGFVDDEPMEPKVAVDYNVFTGVARHINEGRLAVRVEQLTAAVGVLAGLVDKGQLNGEQAAAVEALANLSGAEARVIHWNTNYVAKRAWGAEEQAAYREQYLRDYESYSNCVAAYPAEYETAWAEQEASTNALAEYEAAFTNQLVAATAGGLELPKWNPPAVKPVAAAYAAWHPPSDPPQWNPPALPAIPAPLQRLAADRVALAQTGRPELAPVQIPSKPINVGPR